MHAIICIIEFMNFMLFLIKFIKFKQRIKFKKFEFHNYGFEITKMPIAVYENKIVSFVVISSTLSLIICVG